MLVIGGYEREFHYYVYKVPVFTVKEICQIHAGAIMEVTYAVSFLSSCVTGAGSLPTRCARIRFRGVTPQMA